MSEEIENIIEESLSPDRYCLVHNYIASLQQKVKQLENIRKEAIEEIQRVLDIWTNKPNEIATLDLEYLLNILNKGE